MLCGKLYVLNWSIWFYLQCCVVLHRSYDAALHGMLRMKDVSRLVVVQSAREWRACVLKSGEVWPCW